MKLRVIKDPKEAELLKRELVVQEEKNAANSVSSVCAQCHFEETSAELKTHWKKEYVFASSFRWSGISRVFHPGMEGLPWRVIFFLRLIVRILVRATTHGLRVMMTNMRSSLELSLRPLNLQHPRMGPHRQPMLSMNP
jgi:hypothetical protein